MTVSVEEILLLSAQNCKDGGMTEDDTLRRLIGSSLDCTIEQVRKATRAAFHPVEVEQ